MDSKAADKGENQQKTPLIKVKAKSSYEILDAVTQKYTLDLKQAWYHFKSPNASSKILIHFFSNAENPYVAALQMMVNSPDVHMAKAHTLAVFVIETFSNWLESASNVTRFLTNAIKLDAFIILLGLKNVALLNSTAHAFRMKDDKHLFHQSLKQYLSETKNYKEVCDWAIALEMQEYFSLEEFVIPLLLQGRFQVAQPFLQPSRRLLSEFVGFLDQVLRFKHPEDEFAIIAENLKLDEVKLEQLNFKPLTKLVTRLLNTFDLSPTLAPNLLKSKGRGALNFLLHKKYIDKTISEDSWKEMVTEAIKDDPNLQSELVQGLAHYGDYSIALKMAAMFKVPKYKWPSRLRDYSDGNLPNCNYEVWEEKGTEVAQAEFHKLPIPESEIIVIDTSTKFSDLLEDLKEINLVGIDTEWKPTFAFKKCDLALIQIATCKKVYIVDLVTLGLNPQEFVGSKKSLWERFAVEFFGNSKILKLGFGMSTDVIAMRNVFRKFGITKLVETGFLDLNSVVISLIQEHHFVFPHPSTDKEQLEETRPSISLSNLVKMTLGCVLDKSDQFSNWEKRPLRKSQIIYAALDAYCLLEVFSVLTKECESQKIPFDEVIDNAKDINKIKKPKVKDEEEEINVKVEMVSAAEFRVLCDSDLTPLGELLRKCGIDTTIADFNKDIRPPDGRKKGPLSVITQKTDCRKFKRFGRVLRIKSSDLKDQIAEVVKFYNVKITQSDIDSRCRECNSAEFETITRDEAQKLRASFEEEYVKRFDTEYDAGNPTLPGGSSSEAGTSSRATKSNKMLGQTKLGIPIRICEVPDTVLSQVVFFRVCTLCGRCFWTKYRCKEIVIEDIVNDVD